MFVQFVFIFAAASTRTVALEEQALGRALPRLNGGYDAQRAQKHMVIARWEVELLATIGERDRNEIATETAVRDDRMKLISNRRN